VLGAADRIVVTADSVNMASEACASGRPVFLCAPDGVRGKLARFHASLVAGGHARWLTAAPETFEPVPLVELPAVAAEVRRRFLASRPARAERATLEAPGRP
jgi:mitochondrial fission protein ELM1